MAFGVPSRPAPPPPTPTPPLEVGQIGHDATALMPDAQALHQREQQSPSTVGQEIGDARTRAVQAMNAVRLLTPALRASVREGGSDQEQAARFVALMERANTSAQKACARWGLEADHLNNRWAMNSLERVFVEAMAGQPDPGPGEALVDALVTAADARQCRREEWAELSDAATVQAALLKGMVPVWRAHRQFDFLAPGETLLQECAQKLLDAAASGVVQLVSPLTPASERRTLFQIFVEEGGEVLSDVWSAQAAIAKRAMAGKSAQAILAWRQANPQGLPMDPVWRAFQQQMARLIKLSGSSRPQVRGKRPR